MSNARYVITFLILLSSYSVEAQDQHITDSLKLVTEVAGHDTSVCRAYLSWGEQFYLSNPDTALVLWRKTRDLAEQNLATDLSPELEKRYLLSLAEALNNIGAVYDDLGDIGKGLEHYHKSLNIQERIDDKKGMAISYNNIGVIHKEQGEIEQALEYYFLSLQIKQEINNKKGMALSYNNIGSIYREQGENKNALEYYFLSLQIKQEIQSERGIAQSYHNIGNILCEMDSVDEGMRYLELGLGLRIESGYKAGISSTSSLIGGWLLEVGKVELARVKGLEALEVAKEIGHVIFIKRAAALLCDVYKEQGKYRDALVMYELEIQMRDSMVNEETQKATIRQQTKYEFEKAQLVKDQEEKEEARLATEVTVRRDNLQYSVILIAILILFGGVLALGYISVSERMAEGIIFFSFLIFFEFVLVLADPYIEGWSGGAPGIKLLFNAGIAALIFPAHAFFEARLKGRLVKSK